MGLGGISVWQMLVLLIVLGIPAYVLFLIVKALRVYIRRNDTKTPR